ncbi:unnamed protein product [Sphagnum jensenii]|uniref:Uncharacterized protein n=1 Tax=Sphagnum jensenii TaxID=128206 RepID=A0ABP0WV26_9BRYO
MQSWEFSESRVQDETIEVAAVFKSLKSDLFLNETEAVFGGAHELVQEFGSRQLPCRSWLRRCAFNWKKKKAPTLQGAKSQLRAAAARHSCTDCLDAAAYDPAPRSTAAPPRHSYSEPSTRANFSSRGRISPTHDQFVRRSCEFVRRPAGENFVKKLESGYNVEEGPRDQCCTPDSNPQLNTRFDGQDFDRGHSGSHNVQEEQDAAGTTLAKARESRWLKCMKQLLLKSPAYGSRNSAATPIKLERPAAAAVPAPPQSVCKSNDVLHPGQCTPAKSITLSIPSFDDKPMSAKRMPAAAAAFEKTVPAMIIRPKSLSAPDMSGCGPSSISDMGMASSSSPLRGRKSVTKFSDCSRRSVSLGKVRNNNPPNKNMNRSPSIINNSNKNNINNNNNSSSQMSELHSAVQGAIAHCKKSHTSRAASGQLLHLSQASS